MQLLHPPVIRRLGLRLASLVHALPAVLALAALALPTRSLAQAPAPIVVFGSGISPVQTWDPIFPTTAYANWLILDTPTQTAGPLPNDPHWTNPHAAIVFPKGTHPWEFDPPMNFDAYWINSWATNGQLNKDPGLWSRGPDGQSWTKYSTTITGQGSFVLQFLADNLSWIYLDGVLIGNQGDKWATGTGRYTVNLAGPGPHELVFIIFDGGGLAGGKFRIETTESFQNNNPGKPLPPAPPLTLSLGDIVGGGDGSGNGTYNTGYLATNGNVIGPVFGAQNLAAAGGIAFHAVSGNPLINGVFIPNGKTSISTTGLSYPFPASSALSWDAIRNGISTMEVDGVRINELFDTTGTITTVGVGMHANSGITFDLAAIAALHPGMRPSSLTGNVGGEPNPARCGTGDPIASVIVDGVVVYIRQVELTPSANQLFNITIPVGARFLTLATTDGGNGSGCDKAYFANALLNFIGAPVSAPVVANGSANGTYNSLFAGFQISATNSPTSYGASGLPAGLSVSATTGAITGTPTVVGNFSVDISATNAGGTGHGTLSLNVVKAHADVTLGDLDQTYDGNAKIVTALSSNPSGLSVAISYLGDRTNAGSSPVQAVIDSPFYAGSINGTLKIAKASSSTTTAGAGPFTYDGSTHEGGSGTVTGAGTITGTASLSYSGDQVNAGSYTVTARYAGDANHNPSDGSPVAITINKANAFISVSGYTGTFDGTAHGATGNVFGVDRVELGRSLTLGDSFTDAPGGTAHWTFSGGDNYNSQSGDVAIVINKADAIVSVSGYTGTFDGAAHGATGSATGVGGVNLEGVSLGAAFTNAPGGTAHWAFAGGTNYNGQSGEVAIAIAKANATVNVSGYTGVYDGGAHSATGSATGVGGVSLGGLNPGASFTNAPGGTAHWVFTGGTNYNDQSGDVGITINKANATVSVSGYTGVYDGLAHGATGTATGVGGANLASGFNLGASFTNAPGGTANWSFSGGINYNDAHGTADITINKANATIVVTPYSVEYDGQSHSATYSISGVHGETGATVGTVALSTTHTVVNTYSDSWTFTGANNYNNTNGTLTDDIHDTTAPVIASVTPSTGTLWPPNHQMVAVTLTAPATDLVGVVGYRVTATSSEPDNGLGDGDTPNDIQIAGSGTLNPVINLRAERSGNGDGRTYTITVQAFDAVGNLSAPKTCTVSTPKSQSKK